MKKLKRIAALTVVVLWGILLLTTLVVAFIDSEVTNTLFRGLIYTDIVLPVVAYAMLLVYKFLRGKGTSEEVSSKENK
ncbi:MULTISPECIES: hypothetical protein [Lachnospira]|jgi:uncharacterized membrane protein|uniref:Uncharacterized protein n=1 Tax=Lachnospira multipara TaxID=28051 RepID=A0A1H5W9D4_9FIRM|nr:MULTISPECIES: hypothetical protein [Lachnospira]MCR5515880.1 hypothetical protein [Lachnospira sp.]SEF96084.1 hypothetical protein SAMN05216537_11462 [Lachnospira multipara]